MDPHFGIRLGAKLQMRRVVNYCQWKEVVLFMRWLIRSISP